MTYKTFTSLSVVFYYIFQKINIVLYYLISCLTKGLCSVIFSTDKITFKLSVLFILKHNF